MEKVNKIMSLHTDVNIIEHHLKQINLTNILTSLTYLNIDIEEYQNFITEFNNLKNNHKKIIDKIYIDLLK
jgi:hypothetical protein